MSKKRLIRRIKPDVHSKEHQRKLLKEIMESDYRDSLYELEKFIEGDNMVPSETMVFTDVCERFSITIDWGEHPDGYRVCTEYNGYSMGILEATYLKNMDRIRFIDYTTVEDDLYYKKGYLVVYSVYGEAPRIYRSLEIGGVDSTYFISMDNSTMFMVKDVDYRVVGWYRVEWI